MRNIFTKPNVLGSVRYVLDVSYKERYRSGDWRKVCGQESHNLHSSTNTRVL